MLSIVLSLAQSSHFCLPGPGVSAKPSHSYTFPWEPALYCMKATPAFWRTVSVSPNFCFSSSISWDTCISAESCFPPGLTCQLQWHNTSVCRDGVGRRRKIVTCVRRLPNSSAVTQTYLFQKSHTDMQLNSPAYHTHCVKKN